MFDLWGFLLQTLTVSGVAVLVLFLRVLFRDKLPPRWHFSLWMVLGLALLVPAGWNGRVVLFHWPMLVELLKLWCGAEGVTRVLFPVPVWSGVPETVAEWLFTGYILGILLHAAGYLVAYVRLRCALRQKAAPEVEARVRAVAEKYRLPLCPVRVLSGISGGFLCGIVRPVLVLPAGELPDDKVILHELLHRKHRDTIWSAVICALRCLHWCNPLVVFCAHQAKNDLEARCDQSVLEHLEGEARRDYGRILLEMANRRFCGTPGSTNLHNGRKNLCRRIETIARFRKYPAGMNLVSFCAILLLCVSLTVGAEGSTVREWKNSAALSIASARSVRCTTLAGALDCYGKAVLESDPLARILCAPQDLQASLAEELLAQENTGKDSEWDSGLAVSAYASEGYYLYNLTPVGKNAFEVMLVIRVHDPALHEISYPVKMTLATQTIRAERENGYWVVRALGEFQTRNVQETNLEWGCPELPGTRYRGEVASIQIEAALQTVHIVENAITKSDGMFGTTTSFDTVRKPNATFDRAVVCDHYTGTHLGSEEERRAITQFAMVGKPVWSGEGWPENLPEFSLNEEYASGGSSWGDFWITQKTPEGMPESLFLGGGGTMVDPDPVLGFPEYYAVKLFCNDKPAGELKLEPIEQGE